MNVVTTSTVPLNSFFVLDWHVTSAVPGRYSTAADFEQETKTTGYPNQTINCSQAGIQLLDPEVGHLEKFGFQAQV